MKTKAYLSILLSFLAITSYAQNTLPLVGTWKIISQKIATGNETPVVSDLKTYDALKVVSPTHVAYLSVSKLDSSSSAFIARITVDKDTYTEEFVQARDKAWIGLKPTFKYKIENNKWYIKGGGTFNNVLMEFDEVWEKVK